MEIRDRNGLTEQEFLEAYAKKQYPRPYLTVDIILYAAKNRSILLIRRGGHPFLGRWALPGGFARNDETAEESARRELLEETGVEVSRLRPVGLFSRPGRDPRGWVISQAFLAITDDDVEASAGDDANEAKWFAVTQEKKMLCLVNGDVHLEINMGSPQKSDLAFDHGEMIAEALKMTADYYERKTYE